EPVRPQLSDALSGYPRQEARRQRQYPGSIAGRHGDLSPGQSSFDVGDHLVVVTWLHDDRDVDVRPAVAPASSLAGEPNRGEKEQQPADEGRKQVTAQHLARDCETLRALTIGRYEIAGEPDGERRHDHRDEQGKSQPRLVD